MNNNENFDRDRDIDLDLDLDLDLKFEDLRSIETPDLWDRINQTRKSEPQQARPTIFSKIYTLAAVILPITLFIGVFAYIKNTSSPENTAMTHPTAEQNTAAETTQPVPQCLSIGKTQDFTQLIADLSNLSIQNEYTANSIADLAEEADTIISGQLIQSPERPYYSEPEGFIKIFNKDFGHAENGKFVIPGESKEGQYINDFLFPIAGKPDADSFQINQDQQYFFIAFLKERTPVDIHDPGYVVIPEGLWISPQCYLDSPMVPISKRAQPEWQKNIPFYQLQEQIKNLSSK